MHNFIVYEPPTMEPLSDSLFLLHPLQISIKKIPEKSGFAKERDGGIERDEASCKLIFQEHINYDHFMLFYLFA